MASPARLLANRANALRSTGPRTPAGKARSALNAVRGGLFARLAVLPALGESAGDWEAFRAAVAVDLGPSGPVECLLAARAAELLWRLRRVAAYEAAAASPAALPPDPDSVAPDGGYFGTKPPETSPPEVRLAFARHMIKGCETDLEANAAAAALLAGLRARPASDPAEYGAVRALLDAAGAALGWPPLTPRPWLAVLTELRVRGAALHEVSWTVGLVRRVVRRAAGGGGVSEPGLAAKAGGELVARARHLDGVLGEAGAEEGMLVARMRAARSRAAAAAVLADDGVVGRVARAEGHLGRELERTLALLGKLRAARAPGPDPASVAGLFGPGGVQGAAPGVGFVLRGGRPAAAGRNGLHHPG